MAFWSGIRFSLRILKKHGKLASMAVFFGAATGVSLEILGGVIASALVRSFLYGIGPPRLIRPAIANAEWSRLTLTWLLTCHSSANVPDSATLPQVSVGPQ